MILNQLDLVITVIFNLRIFQILNLGESICYFPGL